MRLSNYILEIDQKSSVLVTGLLTRAVIDIPIDWWKILKDSLVDNNSNRPPNLPIELWNELIDTKIVISNNFDELNYVRTQSLISRSMRDTFGLIIVPTMACNMNCHYCFEKKPSFDLGIQDKIQNRIIPFVKEHLDKFNTKNLHVRWFGGEPLLEFQKLLKITNSLKDLCIQTEKGFASDIVTNGYHLTRESAVKLNMAGIDAAQVTFEGPKRKHDRIRNVGKIGSYDTLLNNITDVSDLISVSARVHVAPHSAKVIPELLEDLASRGFNKILKSIYFAPIFDYNQNNKEKRFESNGNLYLSSSDFAQHEADLLELARKLHFSILDPLDSDYGVCTALRENTAVMNTDGSLTKCYLDTGDTEEVFGNIENEPINPENVEKWRQVDFTHDPVCKSCRFAPVCLGGCAKHASAVEEKDMICTSLKFNYERTIPLYYS